MTKKRQSSSIVNIMEEENLDILDIESEKDVDDASDESYMNVDISTDNIEDIVSAGKIESKSPYEDVYLMIPNNRYMENDATLRLIRMIFDLPDDTE